LTTSEPNEQPPTNAAQGPTGEPPKPARSRRANAAAAQATPPLPDAPTTDGDETRPIAVEPEALNSAQPSPGGAPREPGGQRTPGADASAVGAPREPGEQRVPGADALAVGAPREPVDPLAYDQEAAAVGAPPYSGGADKFDVSPSVAASGASRVASETVYVPLAVSIGDGFKFGCGFFLALVMAMLVGFVLVALLFVLSSVVGLNLPITR
jgi:hypothetical protein